MAVFITERQVTIRLDVLDNIGNRLLEIQKQRDALMAKPNVAIRFDDPGLTKIKQNVLQASAGMAAATQQGRSMGASLATALGNANAQFQRQRDLAKFWGTSSYMHQGLVAFKGNLGGFLSGAGQGFTGWLKGAIGHLAQYKNAIIAAGAAVAGLAIAAGVGSLRSKNYVESVMSTSLMQRKLTNPEGAKSWIELAQKTDWSAGRQERAGIFQSIMSRMPYVNQESGQRFTEDIEKTFAADIEMWKGKGVGSAQQLADLLSTEQLSADQAKMLDDIYGLGFSNRTAQARMERVSFDAGKLDMGAEMEKRPDLVLANRLGKIKEGIGNAMIPAVVKLLGFVIKLTDAWGKFSKSNIGQALFAGIQRGLDWVLGIAGKISGVIGKYFSAADKQFGKSGSYSDSIKAGLGAILGTSSPVYKSLGFVIDFLKKIWVLTDGGKKIFNVIVGMMQRVLDFFSWLITSVKNGVQWIKDGLGLTKAEKKTAMDKAAEKSGYTYVIDKKLGDKYGGTTYTGWLNAGGDKVSPDNLPANIKRAFEEYDKAPDSVFSKIGEVLSGAMSNIITNIGKVFDPVLNPLKTAIVDLLAWLEKWFGGGDEDKVKPDIVNLETGIGVQGDTATGPGTKPTESAPETPRQFYSVAPSKDFGKFDVLLGKQVISTFDTEADAKQALADISAQGPAPAPAMARGGSIIGSGGIFGHSGEEVDPASVVAGGKTTLARINEMFTGGASGGSSITVQAPQVNIHIDKIDKDVDVDRLFAKAGEEFDRKLLFRLRNRLDDVGLRNISYMRG